MISKLLACLVLSDYLTRSEPMKVYIDHESMTEYPDGSYLKPYPTLLEAFESNLNSNVEFWFSQGTHILDFELPENTIQDLSVSFKSSYEVQATLSIINAKFVFPNKNVIELNLENLFIEASNVDKTNCASQKCGNCTLILRESWRGINIVDSTCSKEDEIGLLNLIDLKSYVALSMSNVTFVDFDYDLRTIISSSGGKVNLHNVNFERITLYNTFWSQDFAVIRILCDAETSCEDSLYYDTGIVSEISNNFENIPSLRSYFLYANRNGDIYINNVNFENNFYYRKRNVSYNYDRYFIGIYDSLGKIIIKNNTFQHFFTNTHFIYISHSDLLINDEDILENKLIPTTKSIMFVNNTVRSCYCEVYQIMIKSKRDPINIVISGNLFENSFVPYATSILLYESFWDSTWDVNNTVTFVKDGVYKTITYDPFSVLVENNKVIDVIDFITLNTVNHVTLKNNEYLVTKSVQNIYESIITYVASKNFTYYDPYFPLTDSFDFGSIEGSRDLQIIGLNFSSKITAYAFSLFDVSNIGSVKLSDFYIESLIYDDYSVSFIKIENFDDAVFTNIHISDVEFENFERWQIQYNNEYFFYFQNGKQLEISNARFDWDENGQDIYIKDVETVRIHDLYVQNTYGAFSGSISVQNCLELYVHNLEIENSQGNNTSFYLYNVSNALLENLVVKNSNMAGAIYVKDSYNLMMKNAEIYNSRGEMFGGIRIICEITTILVELQNIYIENTSGNQYAAGIYIEGDLTQLNANNVTLKDLIGDNFGGFVCDGCKNAQLGNINIFNASSIYTAGIHFTGTHIFLISNSNFDSVVSDLNTGCLYLEILNLMNPKVLIENIEFFKCIGINGALSLNQSPDSIVELLIKNSNFISGNGKSDASAIKISEWYQLSENSVIENCSFLLNTALGRTGVLNLNYVGLVTISNSLFQNNIIGSTDKLVSGNFKTNKRVLVIKDTKFIKNSAKSIVDISTLFDGTIFETENCEFTDNKGELISMSKVVWKDYNSRFVSNENVIYSISESEVELNSTRLYKNKGTVIPVMFFIYSSFVCHDCIIDNNYNEVLSLNFDSKLHWKNVTFTNNDNKNKLEWLIYLYANSEKMYFIDCDFTNNIGRGINIIISDVVMENILIQNNIEYDTNHFLNINAGIINITNLNYYSDIQYNQSPILSALSSELHISNSKFLNQFSHGVIDISLADCEIELSHSNFNFNKTKSFDPLIQVINQSNLKITDCDFNENNRVDDSSANIINLAYSSIEIEGTNFNQFSNLALNGIYIDILILKNTQFKFGSHGCVSIFELNSGTVSNSKFANINSIYGSSIFIESTALESNISVFDSVFTSNTAKFGGSLYLKNIDSVISNNEFITNSAEFGGAIYFSCLECSTLINNNNFVENSAVLSGGSTMWTGKNPELVDNKYSNNKAPYGQDVSSYPTQLAFDNKISRVSLEIASSQKIEFPINVNLVDDNLQVVKYGYELLQSTIVGLQNTTVSGTTQAYPKNGIYVFDDIYITAEPETMAHMAITVPKFRTGDDFNIVEALTINISLYVRQCVKGEYLFNDQCIKCQTGTYSFSINENCNDCVNNAWCYGGYWIAPYPGYWHGSNTSEIIYECLTKIACLGGRIEDIGYVSTVGKCRQGYRGNLCGICDDGYSLESQNCAECPKKWFNIIRIIGVSLLLTMLIYITVKTTMKSCFKSKSIFSIYLKIFINYIQLVSLACQLQLNWPDYVQEFLSVQERAGKVTYQILSIDCLMMDQNNEIDSKSLYFDKLLIFSLFPAGLLALLCIFWGFVAIIKKDRGHIWSQFIATSVILFFIIYPSLTNFLFSIFSCVKLYGKDYLVSDLDIKCWDDDHSFYAFSIAFPAILIWSIGVPLLIFCYLKKNRRNLHKLTNKMKFGFLYNGYNESAYFWEFVKIFRNLSFISSLVIFKATSATIQALVSFTIILIYLCLLYLFKPYQKAELNNSEMLSTFVSATTIYCGLYYLTDIPTSGRIILFMFILFSNAAFLLNLIFRIIISKFHPILVKFWVFEVMFENMGYNKVEDKSKITLINESNFDFDKAGWIENNEDVDQLYLRSLKKIEKLSNTVKSYRSEIASINDNIDS